VDISPESKPSPDENYYLFYDHPYSFEADAWIKAGEQPDFPVCIMNAGYSSGWCEESFRIPLVASEVECRAKGDPHCRFIMAHPDRIEKHIQRYFKDKTRVIGRKPVYEIPGFFRRKQIEEELKKYQEHLEEMVRVRTAELIKSNEYLQNEVTERRRAEEALKKNEQYMRTLFDALNVCMMLVDYKSHQIIDVNTNMVNTIGTGKEKIVGSICHRFVCLAEEGKCPVSDLGQTIDSSERIMLTADGREIPVIKTVVPVELEGRKCLLETIVDITERKKAEEAERKLEAEKIVVEELKKLDQVKDEFVSIITHELRTPMTALKVPVEMLLNGDLGEVTDEQKKFLNIMNRNIDRLSHFTTEVLSLSRLQAGRYSLTPETLSIREAVESAVELLRDKAQSHKSSIALEVDANIQAYADGNALTQVLTNLANNAIVHAGESIAIVVSSRKVADDFVEVSVADNGKGIPEDSLPHLFGRFYQVDRKKERGYQGTGIGLSLCKGLVEAMGGKISVRSRVGEGTVFSFTLPSSAPKKQSDKAGQ